MSSDLFNVDFVATINDRAVVALQQKLDALRRQRVTLNLSTSEMVRARSELSFIESQMRSLERSRGFTGQASGVREFGKEIRQVNGLVEEYGHLSGLAAKRALMFSIGAGAIYGIQKAVRSGITEFVKFDDQMVRIGQVLGRTKEGVSDLSDDITQLSVNLGLSSAKLTEVALVLAQAGMRANETKIAMDAVAKATLTPTFDDMQNTVEGIIASMSQFNLKAQDMEEMLGSINAVSKAFAVESNDIIAAIRRTGSVFAEASDDASTGLEKMNQFMAMFTSVRSATRESAETIATGLRTIITRMERVGTISSFEDLGIQLQNLEGQFVGPYEAINRISEALINLNPRDSRFSKIVEELGGFRQVSKVVPLITQLQQRREAYNVAVAGGASLEEDAAKRADSWAIRLTKVHERFLAMTRSFGNDKTIDFLAKNLLKITESTINFADSIRPLLPMLVMITGVKMAQNIGPILSSIKKGFVPSGTAPSSPYSSSQVSTDLPALGTTNSLLEKIEQNTRVSSQHLSNIKKSDAEGFLRSGRATFEDYSGVQTDPALLRMVSTMYRDRNGRTKNVQGVVTGVAEEGQSLPGYSRPKGQKGKVYEVFEGLDAAGDARKSYVQAEQMIQSTARMMNDVIQTRQLLNQFFQNQERMPKGFNTGGNPWNYKSSGGEVQDTGFRLPSAQRGSDVIPAMLTVGEAVIPARQAREHRGLIQRIIANHVFPNNQVQYYSRGTSSAGNKQYFNEREVARLFDDEHLDKIVPGNIVQFDYLSTDEYLPQEQDPESKRRTRIVQVLTKPEDDGSFLAFSPYSYVTDKERQDSQKALEGWEQKTPDQLKEIEGTFGIRQYHTARTFYHDQERMRMENLEVIGRGKEVWPQPDQHKYDSNVRWNEKAYGNIEQSPFSYEKNKLTRPVHRLDPEEIVADRLSRVTSDRLSPQEKTVAEKKTEENKKKSVQYQRFPLNEFEKQRDLALDGLLMWQADNKSHVVIRGTKLVLPTEQAIQKIRDLKINPETQQSPAIPVYFPVEYGNLVNDVDYKKQMLSGSDFSSLSSSRLISPEVRENLTRLIRTAPPSVKKHLTGALREDIKNLREKIKNGQIQDLGGDTTTSREFLQKSWDRTLEGWGHSFRNMNLAEGENDVVNLMASYIATEFSKIERAGEGQKLSETIGEVLGKRPDGTMSTGRRMEFLDKMLQEEKKESLSRALDVLTEENAPLYGSDMAMGKKTRLAADTVISGKDGSDYNPYENVKSTRFGSTGEIAAGLEKITNTPKEIGPAIQLWKDHQAAINYREQKKGLVFSTMGGLGIAVPKLILASGRNETFDRFVEGSINREGVSEEDSKRLAHVLEEYRSSRGGVERIEQSPDYIALFRSEELKARHQELVLKKNEIEEPVFNAFNVKKDDIKGKDFKEIYSDLDKAIKGKESGGIDVTRLRFLAENYRKTHENIDELENSRDYTIAFGEKGRERESVSEYALNAYETLETIQGRISKADAPPVDWTFDPTKDNTRFGQKIYLGKKPGVLTINNTEGPLPGYEDNKEQYLQDQVGVINEKSKELGVYATYNPTKDGSYIALQNRNRTDLANVEIAGEDGQSLKTLSDPERSGTEAQVGYTKEAEGLFHRRKLLHKAIVSQLTKGYTVPGETTRKLNHVSSKLDGLRSENPDKYYGEMVEYYNAGSRGKPSATAMTNDVTELATHQAQLVRTIGQRKIKENADLPILWTQQYKEISEHIEKTLHDIQYGRQSMSDVAKVDREEDLYAEGDGGLGTTTGYERRQRDSNYFMYDQETQQALDQLQDEERKMLGIDSSKRGTNAGRNRVFETRHHFNQVFLSVLANAAKGMGTSAADHFENIEMSEMGFSRLIGKYSKGGDQTNKFVMGLTPANELLLEAKFLRGMYHRGEEIERNEPGEGTKILEYAQENLSKMGLSPDTQEGLRLNSNIWGTKTKSKMRGNLWESEAIGIVGFNTALGKTYGKGQRMVSASVMYKDAQSKGRYHFEPSDLVRLIQSGNINKKSISDFAEKYSVSPLGKLVRIQPQYIPTQDEINAEKDLIMSEMSAKGEDHEKVDHLRSEKSIRQGTTQEQVIEDSGGAITKRIRHFGTEEFFPGLFDNKDIDELAVRRLKDKKRGKIKASKLERKDLITDPDEMNKIVSAIMKTTLHKDDLSLLIDEQGRNVSGSRKIVEQKKESEKKLESVKREISALRQLGKRKGKLTDEQRLAHSRKIEEKERLQFEIKETDQYLNRNNFRFIDKSLQSGYDVMTPTKGYTMDIVNKEDILQKKAEKLAAYRKGIEYDTLTITTAEKILGPKKDGVSYTESDIGQIQTDYSQEFFGDKRTPFIQGDLQSLEKGYASYKKEIENDKINQDRKNQIEKLQEERSRIEEEVYGGKRYSLLRQRAFLEGHLSSDDPTKDRQLGQMDHLISKEEDPLQHSPEKQERLLETEEQLKDLGVLPKYKTTPAELQPGTEEYFLHQRAIQTNPETHKDVRTLESRWKEGWNRGAWREWEDVIAMAGLGKTTEQQIQESKDRYEGSGILAEDAEQLKKLQTSSSGVVTSTQIGALISNLEQTGMKKEEIEALYEPILREKKKYALMDFFNRRGRVDMKDVTSSDQMLDYGPLQLLEARKFLKNESVMKDQKRAILLDFINGRLKQLDLKTLNKTQQKQEKQRDISASQHIETNVWDANLDETKKKIQIVNDMNIEWNLARQGKFQTGKKDPEQHQKDIVGHLVTPKVREKLAKKEKPIAREIMYPSLVESVDTLGMVGIRHHQQLNTGKENLITGVRRKYQKPSWSAHTGETDVVPNHLKTQELNASIGDNAGFITQDIISNYSDDNSIVMEGTRKPVLEEREQLARDVENLQKERESVSKKIKSLQVFDPSTKSSFSIGKQGEIDDLMTIYSSLNRETIKKHALLSQAEKDLSFKIPESELLLSKQYGYVQGASSSNFAAKDESGLTKKSMDIEGIRKIASTSRMTDTDQQILLFNDIIDEYGVDSIPNVILKKIAPEVFEAIGARKFQKGGRIPGYGGGDKEPVLLEKGEFVVNKDAARKNLEVLNQINQNGSPVVKDGIPRFLYGGIFSQDVLDMAAMQSYGILDDSIKDLINNLETERTSNPSSYINEINDLPSQLEALIQGGVGSDQMDIISNALSSYLAQSTQQAPIAPASQPPAPTQQSQQSSQTQAQSAPAPFVSSVEDWIRIANDRDTYTRFKRISSYLTKNKEALPVRYSPVDGSNVLDLMTRVRKEAKASNKPQAIDYLTRIKNHFNKNIGKHVDEYTGLASSFESSGNDSMSENIKDMLAFHEGINTFSLDDIYDTFASKPKTKQEKFSDDAIWSTYIDWVANDTNAPQSYSLQESAYVIGKKSRYDTQNELGVAKDSRVDAATLDTYLRNLSIDKRSSIRSRDDVFAFFERSEDKQTESEVKKNAKDAKDMADFKEKTEWIQTIKEQYSLREAGYAIGKKSKEETLKALGVVAPASIGATSTFPKNILQDYVDRMPKEDWSSVKTRDDMIDFISKYETKLDARQVKAAEEQEKRRDTSWLGYLDVYDEDDLMYIFNKMPSQLSPELQKDILSRTRHVDKKQVRGTSDKMLEEYFKSTPSPIESVKAEVHFKKKYEALLKAASRTVRPKTVPMSKSNPIIEESNQPSELSEGLKQWLGGIPDNERDFEKRIFAELKSKSASTPFDKDWQTSAFRVRMLREEFQRQFNKLPRFQKGGRVGGLGRGDKIHAVLEPGEFVIKHDIVAKYGEEFFSKLNQGGSPHMIDGVPRFATGGGVKDVTNVFKNFTTGTGGSLAGLDPSELIRLLSRSIRGFGEETSQALAREGTNFASDLAGDMEQASTEIMTRLADAVHRGEITQAQSDEIWNSEELASAREQAVRTRQRVELQSEWEGSADVHDFIGRTAGNAVTTGMDSTEIQRLIPEIAKATRDSILHMRDAAIQDITLTRPQAEAARTSSDTSLAGEERRRRSVATDLHTGVINRDLSGITTGKDVTGRSERRDRAYGRGLREATETSGERLSRLQIQLDIVNQELEEAAISQERTGVSVNTDALTERKRRLEEVSLGIQESLNETVRRLDENIDSSAKEVESRQVMIDSLNAEIQRERSSGDPNTATTAHLERRRDYEERRQRAARTAVTTTTEGRSTHDVEQITGQYNQANLIAENQRNQLARGTTTDRTRYESAMAQMRELRARMTTEQREEVIPGYNAAQRAETGNLERIRNDYRSQLRRRNVYPKRVRVDTTDQGLFDDFDLGTQEEFRSKHAEELRNLNRSIFEEAERNIQTLTENLRLIEEELRNDPYDAKLAERRRELESQLDSEQNISRNVQQHGDQLSQTKPQVGRTFRDQIKQVGEGISNNMLSLSFLGMGTGSMMGSSEYLKANSAMMGVSRGISSGSAVAIAGNSLGSMVGPGYGGYGAIIGAGAGTAWGAAQGIHEAEMNYQRMKAEESLTRATKNLAKEFERFEKTGSVEGVQKALEEFGRSSRQSSKMLIRDAATTFEMLKAIPGFGTEFSQEGALSENLRLNSARNTGMLWGSFAAPIAAMIGSIVPGIGTIASGAVAGGTAMVAGAAYDYFGGGSKNKELERQQIKGIAEKEAQNNQAAADVFAGLVAKNLEQQTTNLEEQLRNPKLKEGIVAYATTYGSEEDKIQLERLKLAQDAETVEGQRKILAMATIVSRERLRVDADQIMMQRKLKDASREATREFDLLFGRLEKLSAVAGRATEEGYRAREESRLNQSRISGTGAIANIQSPSVFQNLRAYSTAEVMDQARTLALATGDTRKSREMESMAVLAKQMQALIPSIVANAAGSTDLTSEQFGIKVERDLRNSFKGAPETIMQSIVSDLRSRITEVSKTQSSRTVSAEEFVQGMDLESMSNNLVSKLTQPITAIQQSYRKIIEDFTGSMEQHISAQDQMNKSIVQINSQRMESEMRYRESLSQLTGFTITAGEKISNFQDGIRLISLQGGTDTNDVSEVVSRRDLLMGQLDDIRTRRMNTPENQVDNIKNLVDQEARLQTSILSLNSAIEQLSTDSTQLSAVMQEVAEFERKRDSASRQMDEWGSLDPRQLMETFRGAAGHQALIATGGRAARFMTGDQLRDSRNVGRQMSEFLISIGAISKQRGKELEIVNQRANIERLGGMGVFPPAFLRMISQTTLQQGVDPAAKEEINRLQLEQQEALTAISKESLDKQDVTNQNLENIYKILNERLNTVQSETTGVDHNLPGFAKGGFIPGRGSLDTVKAMLTPGEFVVRKDVAQKNKPALVALNQGSDISIGEGIVQYAADGGEILARKAAAKKRFYDLVRNNDTMSFSVFDGIETDESYIWKDLDTKNDPKLARDILLFAKRTGQGKSKWETWAGESKSQELVKEVQDDKKQIDQDVRLTTGNFDEYVPDIDFNPESLLRSQSFIDSKAFKDLHSSLWWRKSSVPVPLIINRKHNEYYRKQDFLRKYVEFMKDIAPLTSPVHGASGSSIDQVRDFQSFLFGGSSGIDEKSQIHKTLFNDVRNERGYNEMFLSRFYDDVIAEKNRWMHEGLVGDIVATEDIANIKTTKDNFLLHGSSLWPMVQKKIQEYRYTGDMASYAKDDIDPVLDETTQSAQEVQRLKEEQKRGLDKFDENSSFFFETPYEIEGLINKIVHDGYGNQSEEIQNNKKRAYTKRFLESYTKNHKLQEIETAPDQLDVANRFYDVAVRNNIPGHQEYSHRIKELSFGHDPVKAYYQDWRTLERSISDKSLSYDDILRTYDNYMNLDEHSVQRGHSLRENRHDLQDLLRFITQSKLEQAGKGSVDQESLGLLRGLYIGQSKSKADIGTKYAQLVGRDGTANMADLIAAWSNLSEATPEEINLVSGSSNEKKRIDDIMSGVLDSLWPRSEKRYSHSSVQEPYSNTFVKIKDNQLTFKNEDDLDNIYSHVITKYDADLNQLERDRQKYIEKKGGQNPELESKTIADFESNQKTVLELKKKVYDNASSRGMDSVRFGEISKILDPQKRLRALEEEYISKGNAISHPKALNEAGRLVLSGQAQSTFPGANYLVALNKLDSKDIDTTTYSTILDHLKNKSQITKEDIDATGGSRSKEQEIRSSRHKEYVKQALPWAQKASRKDTLFDKEVESLTKEEGVVGTGRKVDIHDLTEYDTETYNRMTPHQRKRFIDRVSYSTNEKIKDRGLRTPKQVALARSGASILLKDAIEKSGQKTVNPKVLMHGVGEKYFDQILKDFIKANDLKEKDGVYQFKGDPLYIQDYDPKIGPMFSGIKGDSVASGRGKVKLDQDTIKAFKSRYANYNSDTALALFGIGNEEYDSKSLLDLLNRIQSTKVTSRYIDSLKSTGGKDTTTSIISGRNAGRIGTGHKDEILLEALRGKPVSMASDGIDSIHEARVFREKKFTEEKEAWQNSIRKKINKGIELADLDQIDEFQRKLDEGSERFDKRAVKRSKSYAIEDLRNPEIRQSNPDRIEQIRTLYPDVYQNYEKQQEANIRKSKNLKEGAERSKANAALPGDSEQAERWSNLRKLESEIKQLRQETGLKRGSRAIDVYGKASESKIFNLELDRTLLLNDIRLHTPKKRPIYRATGGSVDSSVFISQGSDTIPAMLTPGEFVVRKEVADRYRPQLEAINHGTGGLVRNGVHYLAGGSGSNTAGYRGAQNSQIIDTNGLDRFNVTFYRNGDALIRGLDKSFQYLENVGTGFKKMFNYHFGGSDEKGEKGSPGTFDSFQNGMSSIVKDMNKAADKLGRLASIPSDISIKGRCDVMVTINGDSVLSSLTPNIREMVGTEIKKAMGLKFNAASGNLNEVTLI